MSDYETDIVVWSEQQADLLRRLAAGEPVNNQIDWENVAEEIESLGRSDRRELANRVATILVHLIKLQTSPATQPRAGWRDTILAQRRGIRRLIKESPSLHPTIAAVISEELADAKESAILGLSDNNEQPRADLAALDFTEDQVLGPWLPAAPDQTCG